MQNQNLLTDEESSDDNNLEEKRNGYIQRNSTSQYLIHSHQLTDNDNNHNNNNNEAEEKTMTDEATTIFTPPSMNTRNKHYKWQARKFQKEIDSNSTSNYLLRPSQCPNDKYVEIYTPVIQQKNHEKHTLDNLYQPNPYHNKNKKRIRHNKVYHSTFNINSNNEYLIQTPLVNATDICSGKCNDKIVRIRGKPMLSTRFNGQIMITTTSDNQNVTVLIDNATNYGSDYVEITGRVNSSCKLHQFSFVNLWPGNNC